MKPWIINRWKWMVLLLAAALLSVGGYLLYTAWNGFLGFPLDDAWIHQVYARNLAEGGEWAFNPGEPSGGSTSPLWSLLMSAGHVARIHPVIWSGLLGWLILFLIAVFAEELVRSWIPDYKPLTPWVGFFFTFEWHLIWASVSGMETSLYVLFVLFTFFALSRKTPLIGTAGLIIGICTWIRPDGLTLLGPALMFIVLSRGSKSARFSRISILAGSFLLVFIPYLLFNLHFAGSIWPTTFSAKQAEYAAATGYPLLQRLWWLLLPFLAGGGIILLPGVILSAWFSWEQKKVLPGTMFLWISGYLLIYALKLPVYYQHGRYMIPAMAGFFLVGLWGWLTWMRKWPEVKWARLAHFFLTTCMVAVTGVFFFIGAGTFRTDTAIIETEMVHTARWVRSNVPAGSRVAAHDIGAMGYFSGHEIIDLAGLVNPEIIPIIRDESAIERYLDKQKVDFFVTFPGWFPLLTAGREAVFRSEGSVSIQSGGENMAVFRW